MLSKAPMCKTSCIPPVHAGVGPVAPMLSATLAHCGRRFMANAMEGSAASAPLGALGWLALTWCVLLGCVVCLNNASGSKRDSEIASHSGVWLSWLA